MQDNLIKGLFFDLDGTLCDTDEANYVAYSKALGEMGYTITPEEFSTTVGLRADVFIPRLAAGISETAVKQVMSRKSEIYVDTLHMVRPNKELISFLSLMKPLHTVVLVTTAKQVNAQNVLKAVGLDKLFDHMVFGDQVDRPKPDPEAYLRALALAGLKSDQAIAFEDSEAGMEAATAAGIKVLKVAF